MLIYLLVWRCTFKFLVFVWRRSLTQLFGLPEVVQATSKVRVQRILDTDLPWGMVGQVGVCYIFPGRWGTFLWHCMQESEYRQKSRIGVMWENSETESCSCTSDRLKRKDLTRKTLVQSWDDKRLNKHLSGFPWIEMVRFFWYCKGEMQDQVRLAMWGEKDSPELP